MAERALVTFRKDGDTARVTLSDPRRPAALAREGHGSTWEAGIAHAMGRPGLRFATAADELRAEVAAFRGRGLHVLAGDTRIHSLELG